MELTVTVLDKLTNRWMVLVGNIDAPLSAFHTIGYVYESLQWHAYAMNKRGEWVYIQTYLKKEHAVDAVVNRYEGVS